ncbi:MAG: ATP-dependent DNA helicase [Phycisphaerales bacterium]|nr:ATP-dependent DNA helicase [Phycisphaerales bacterium]
MTLAAEVMLSDAGPIARRLPGFEVRPQQIEMACAVDACLERRGRLIVEAGTGVGKSFAYLIPAIRQVVEHQQRVVICTNTIPLQEQLIDSDIPLLNAVIPDEFTAVLVKGRSNYVSLRRLKLATSRQDRLFGGDTERHALEQLDQWAHSTRDGTTASLPVHPPAAVWEQVGSDAGNCMGRKCPTYNECFFQTARRRMEGAQLLICNHALFFSDLALRASGARGFLPAYGHVILDEAHSVEEVAADHFGARLSEAAIGHMLRSLWNATTHRGVLQSIPMKEGGDETLLSALQAVEVCRNAASHFFGSLYRWRQSQRGDSEVRVREPGIVEDCLSGPLRALGTLLQLVRERAADEADGFEVNAYAQRTTGYANDCAAVIAQSIPGCVYWVESGSRKGRGSSSRPELSLAAAAIEVGPLLQKHLYSQDISVVLTSGTLAASRDDCRMAASTYGLADATTLVLGSPFDYARQVRVYLEADLPDPRDEGATAAIAKRVLHHIEATDGGAFVLCTSKQALEELAAATASGLAARGHPVHVQGRGGANSVLLRRFREDERSVLFGVASFWQGIDVRGRALRNVIITRLPFEPPDAPLTQARHERIDARGGNSFMEDSLPRAIIRFRQGFGRLVRSSTDTGRVVVLDSRIVRKKYGRLFLEALPEGMRIEGPDGLEWNATL